MHDDCTQTACMDCGALGPEAQISGGPDYGDELSVAAWNRRAALPAAQPRLTNKTRGILMWLLWHHQGGDSPVGQPIRISLGMGQRDQMDGNQVAIAKSWDRHISATARDKAAPAAQPTKPDTVYLAQVSGEASTERGALLAAPLDSYPPEDQAFFRFWYGHMLNDLMQPPLAGVSHATARYIWDAAVATPVAVQPVTDGVTGMDSKTQAPSHADGPSAQKTGES
jgi:hypothetical protein